MKRSLADYLPVYGIEEGCILSRQGDYTVAYRVSKPEIFTLSGEEYEAFHQAFVKAIRVLPANCVLHLQDWYTAARYRADFEGSEKSWLGRASERFFNERPCLDHTAYLFLTKKAGDRKDSTSALSGLLRPHLVGDGLDERGVQDFISHCGQFRRILEDSGFLSLERMGKAELWSSRDKAGLIERYCQLQTEERPILKDILFGDSLRIGDLHTLLFTLGDAEDLPSQCGPRTDYDVYSTDRTKFSTGFATGLGPLLPTDHICNQYVFIGDAGHTLKKMESRRLRLQSLAAYSRENAISQEATNSFLNEAVAEQRLPVKAHVNVLAWTREKGDLPEIRNRISSALAQLGASPRQETAGAPQIWWAGIPGNAGDFPMNDTFDTFAEQAACLFQYETNYRSSLSPFGLRFGDRISGRPVHVDIDDEPRARGIIANGNMVVVSGSGGGKSFFTNHLTKSYYEQGAHIVLIDVGHSYEIQCALHGGYYFTYEENNPIRFNPFYLGIGDVLDTEKKESIKTLLLALWKKSDEAHNRSEYVALSNALQLYFEKLAGDKTIFPGFDSFYEFLQTDFSEVLRADHVKDKDFDMANFLYVLRPYYRGGEFDYLLNATQNLDLLQERFIVFELDNIKSHPILFPVVTLIIMELFVSKMRKLKGIRKVIVVEEAWKAIAQQGMAEYIKFLFKTVRKFHAKAIVVTQEIEDIISSDIVKQAIINNADIKVLLDQSKFQNKFGQLQELLGITDKQKAEILSINKGHEPGRLYKDCWIGLGATHSKVYRLEVSPEEYYVYTSDQQEKVRVKEYIKKYGGVKEGIRMLVAKRILVWALIMVLPVLLPRPVRAQGPISIVTEAVTIAIKAVDLEIQRIQTSTIWLEEAQKTLENAMSQFDLQDIANWVANQKDLYTEYFQELWQVKTAISDYHRVAEIIQRQEQIIARYQQAYGLLRQDPHFSATEISHMQAVYTGIVNESLKNLDQLTIVINSFTTQMSDERRMAIIDAAGANIDKNYDDLTRYTNENELLSLQRAEDANELDFLKKLYGL